MSLELTRALCTGEVESRISRILSPAEYRVLSVLAFRADAKHFTWPSVARLQIDTRIKHRRSIFRAMAGLRDLGLIEAVGYASKAGVRRISLAPLVRLLQVTGESPISDAVDDLQVTGESLPSDSSVTPGVTGESPPSDRRVTPLTGDRRVTRKEERSKKKSKERSAAGRGGGVGPVNGRHPPPAEEKEQGEWMDTQQGIAMLMKSLECGVTSSGKGAGQHSKEVKDGNSSGIDGGGSSGD